MPVLWPIGPSEKGHHPVVGGLVPDLSDTTNDSYRRRYLGNQGLCRFFDELEVRLCNILNLFKFENSFV
jgi:hypothetical protein